MIERTYTKEVNIEWLRTEILSSPQGIPLNSIGYRDGVLTVVLDGEFVEAYVLALDEVVAAHTIKAEPGEYANNHIWSKELESVTSAAKFPVAAHTWKLPILSTGTYKLSWMCSYMPSGVSTVASISVIIDGNTVFNVNVGRMFVKGASNTVTGFDILELPLLREHTIELGFSVVTPGSLTINNSTFELEKLY